MQIIKRFFWILQSISTNEWYLKGFVWSLCSEFIFQLSVYWLLSLIMRQRSSKWRKKLTENMKIYAPSLTNCPSPLLRLFFSLSLSLSVSRLNIKTKQSMIGLISPYMDKVIIKLFLPSIVWRVACPCGKLFNFPPEIETRNKCFLRIPFI